jgi:hypothetical protein
MERPGLARRVDNKHVQVTMYSNQRGAHTQWIFQPSEASLTRTLETGVGEADPAALTTSVPEESDSRKTAPRKYPYHKSPR